MDCLSCLDKPFFTFPEEKGFSSSYKDGIADAAATDLFRCCAALIQYLVDVKHLTIVPSDEPGKDCALLVHIHVY